jgi:hypothetical protein
VRILPDRVDPEWSNQALLRPSSSKPMDALHGTLQEIAGRYGRETSTIVAVQLELPQHDAR